MADAQREDNGSFHQPDEPGPSSRATSDGHGGTRHGAGRKRIHEEGYKSVRSVLWKSISVHTNVYEEWLKERQRRGFTNNSDFARFPLENLKSPLQDHDSTSRESMLGHLTQRCV